jgi:hypothetical protein
MGRRKNPHADFSRVIISFECTDVGVVAPKLLAANPAEEARQEGCVPNFLALICAPAYNINTTQNSCVFLNYRSIRSIKQPWLRFIQTAKYVSCLGN